MIQVSALRWAAPFGQGLVRDLRVRWALEEAGLAYEERLVGPDEQASAPYRRLQPFGQVPAFSEDGLELFESGAIVLHIGERAPVLLPRDPHLRARTIAWMFASLNTVEPPIMYFKLVLKRDASDPQAVRRSPVLLEQVRTRLRELAAWLDGRDYLLDEFTAADLLMTTVLRILRQTDLVAEAGLADYKARCESRPAFQRALAAQLAAFAANAPTSPAGASSGRGP